jgi:ribosomal protein L32
MILNPLSQHPITLCDSCGSRFEQGDATHEHIEHGYTLCDECWHEEMNHRECDECGEWIEDEKEMYLDEEDDKYFCNEECHVSYYSAKVENAKENIE